MRAVSLHVERNGRCYLPELRRAWADDDEWYAYVTIGNRHCDPLFGVTVSFKGRFVRRVGDWLLSRARLT